MSKKNDNTRDRNERTKIMESKKNVQSYRQKRHLGLNMLACMRASAMMTFVQLITPIGQQEDDGIDVKGSTGKIATWINVRSMNEAR